MTRLNYYSWQGHWGFLPNLEKSKVRGGGSTNQPEGKKGWVGTEQGREKKGRKKQSSFPHWMDCNYLASALMKK